MQGYFGVAELENQNSGIAAIVPAQKITELLNTPQAEAFRLLQIANFYLGKL
jgi:hypothetical protein